MPPRKSINRPLPVTTVPPEPPDEPAGGILGDPAESQTKPSRDQTPTTEVLGVVRGVQTVNLPKGASITVLLISASNVSGVGMLKVIGDAEVGDTVAMTTRTVR